MGSRVVGASAEFCGQVVEALSPESVDIGVVSVLVIEELPDRLHRTEFELDVHGGHRKYPESEEAEMSLNSEYTEEVSTSSIE